MDDLLERYRQEQAKRAARNEPHTEEGRKLGVEYTCAREAEGLNRLAIAADLSVDPKTLREWLHAAGVPPKGKHAAVFQAAPPSGGFREVRLREKREAISPAGSLVITTANGLRLEGLTLTGAIELLRAMDAKPC